MNERIATAIKNYDEAGWGAELPKEDRENVHDFVISRLASSQDITVREAIKLVHVLEGGSWSDGWEKGYSSAKNHYSPSFSLRS